jgi:lysine-specific demethylase 3
MSLDRTRMHMDIADAINVMTYASENDDGTEGCAVWHVYREEDLDKLRRFLKDKFGSEHAFNDPVHSQVFYLDTKLRKELYDATGITSFQIYQHPVSEGQCELNPRC